MAYCDTDRWVDRAASGECPTSRPESSSPTTPSIGETTTTPDGAGASGEIRLFNPLGADTTIPQFIGKMVRAVVGVVGAIALLMFVYGGILWMTAGSGERVKTAKEIIKNSLIGILLIFLSYSIISFFFSLFG